MSAPEPAPDVGQPPGRAGWKPAPRRRSLAGAAGRGCLAGLLVCLAAEVHNLLLGCNLHVVVPGAVYRCGQPSGAELERLVRAHGIRTVINLRGCCDSLEWFRDECRAANRLNISMESIALSAGHLPPVGEVRRLVEVLDRSEYPVLFHCFRGVDRTGLASAVALLLRTDTPLRQARHALSLRFVHLPWGRTGHLDEFLDLYEGWLGGRPHSPGAFRTWLERGYVGGACRCRLEAVGPALVGPSGSTAPVLELPGGGRRLRVPPGVPFAVRVRCHNTSSRAWHLHPNLNAGVHGHWMLLDGRDAYYSEGKAGRFRAVVPPGGSVVLTFTVPAVPLPGRYTLQVDMIEEQHCYFHEVGSEPLELEVDVS